MDEYFKLASLPLNNSKTYTQKLANLLMIIGFFLHMAGHSYKDHNFEKQYLICSSELISKFKRYFRHATDETKALLDEVDFVTSGTLDRIVEPMVCEHLGLESRSLGYF